MNIAMIAGEAAPFAKAGGLADVIGALPVQLERLGVQCSVVIPRYRSIDLAAFEFVPYPLPEKLEVPLGLERLPVEIHAGVLPHSKVPVFLIGCDRFFGREGIYVDVETGKDYPDQADRWIFFQRAALEFLRVAIPDVDILHCHDYHTGLVPAYLRKLYQPRHMFRRARTVFTIHNMGYQGLFPSDVMARTGFEPAEYYPTGPFEFYGKVNFMKVGVTFADLVTTVSETYARELRHHEFANGLEDVLAARPDGVHGILNGIDLDVWSPETDPLIPATFSADSLDRKADNKKTLLKEFGLKAARSRRPLLAMISRIDTQKGFDLLIAILDGLLKEDLSFVMLGTGNKATQAGLQAIVERHPDRAAIRFAYNNKLAHLIEAGADIFLMPSKYEPCGLNQMYSMRYGTVPVVRATGGLADTVKEFDPATGAGTGFTFREFRPQAFDEAIHRALNVFRDPKEWRRIMQNGMAADFSWSRSAGKYLEAYGQIG